MSNHDEYENERGGEIRAVMSFVLVLVIFVVAIGVAVLLFVNRVKLEPDEAERSLPGVQVVSFSLGQHEPLISSEGAVTSRREVCLAAEVSGRVESISPSLVQGGTVKEGDELAVIEDADFKAALARAKSSLADAELNLELEKARGEQARKDWEKLGRGKASPLVLREPQIASAEARVESSKAEVERAQRDIERTVIRAPFHGRVREAGVEVGAVVIPGAMIAELYSDEDLEVRLPFSLRDFGLVRREGTPRFELTAKIGSEQHAWPAELVRVEGEVERSTLSGYAIAKVLADETGMYPPVGLFVKTQVKGKLIDEVVTIPRSALRGSSDVWVVSEGKLAKRTVSVVRSSREAIIVKGDFQPGDLVVTTRLSAPFEGMEVAVLSEDGDAQEEPVAETE